MFVDRDVPVSGLQDANSTRSPCPSSNGSTIGSQQSYTLFCGLDIAGYDLMAYHADNLTTCIGLCNRHHPKCFAAAFEASQEHGTDNCYLKRYAPTTPQAEAYVIDTVVLNDNVTSKRDCPQLGATYQAPTSAGRAFNTSCGFDYARDDLTDAHAESLAECIDICSTYVDGSQGCAAVSYEAKQLNGYNNCYLKSQFSTTGLSKGSSILVDTAYLLPSDTSSQQGSTAAAGSGGNSTSGSSAGTLSAAAIGGVAAGGAVGLVIILALGVCLLRQRRRLRRLEQQQAEGHPTGPIEYLPPLVDQGTPRELKAEEIRHYLPEFESPGRRTELDTVRPVEMPTF